MSSPRIKTILGFSREDEGVRQETKPVANRRPVITHVSLYLNFMDDIL
jgi:hypothetical protein